MKYFFVIILFIIAEPLHSYSQQYDTIPDTRKLEIALDYFTGGKYHEALMMFLKLDKRYNLNPRFKAYIGLCYYHEWEYPQACKFLDEALPSLAIYSPAERSLYYNAAAESHFALKEYIKAIPAYEMCLLTCRQNEKADALYRIGFCYMFTRQWVNAADYFKSALAYYEAYPNSNSATRIAQLKNMIKGCENMTAGHNQAAHD